MKKFIIAAFMLVGFAGISMAQTAPAATTTHSKTSTSGTHKHAGKHGAHHAKKSAAAVK